ncbi:uncharacterized protein I206_105990 [Kwoniella pini CBS 10737]|uniref:Transmembrane protein n=1 Tax=Kwoniella pini CBS 10737 TaxID=1296096 RepID=A0A1B9I0Q4_9TREE|nr:uncharacterized protein I206_04813 [Kwoniella pini CBS 10737]OCF49126.1 transmembrane protein [Kwoniella pini CBS 10737]
MASPPPPSYSSPTINPSSSSSTSNSTSTYPKPPLVNKKSSTIITFHEELSEDQEEIVEGNVASSLPNHMKSSINTSGGNNSIPLSRTNSNTSSLAEEGELNSDQSIQQQQVNENTSLLNGNDNKLNKKWYKGPYFVTAVKFSILFTIFTIVLVCTFYFGMPKLDKEDKGVVKLPRSFADLQALNTLFQKYKTRYPFRILACAVVTYLFVQTFTLPGSMYISILFGAAYGMIYGLLLSCLCDAFGSLLCYTLSSLLAPPLLTMPFYRARVETWRIKIMGDPKKGKKVTWDSVFAFLLVLRIAPFPPHWVANFVAPHLGIGMFMFWSSCFIGIAPVSVIHVTIGSSLDSMTSAADFHILSLRNILGLLAVVVAVLIPVGLKKVFKKDLGDLGEAEEILIESNRDEREINIPSINGELGRRYHAIDSGVVLSLPSKGILGNKLIRNKNGNSRQLEIIHDEDEEDDDEEEEEFDEDELEERLFDAQQDFIIQNENQIQIENENEIENEDSNQYASGSGYISPNLQQQEQEEENQQQQQQEEEEIRESSSFDNQYMIYDPSGKIKSITYNPIKNKNRSRSSSIQRPKSMKRHNTNLSIKSKNNLNYGTINSLNENQVEI